MTAGKCFNCGKAAQVDMYGFGVCRHCRPKLALMTDATIRRRRADDPTFAKIAKAKIAELDISYARKRIKLLHIMDRLKTLR